MFPVCLCFSAFFLSSADGVLGGAEVDGDDGDAEEGDATLSLVLRKTSNIVCSFAGLMLSCFRWVSLDGSTPKASPMHWTGKGESEG